METIYKIFSPATSRWIAQAFGTPPFRGLPPGERDRILATCRAHGTGPQITDDPVGRDLFSRAVTYMLPTTRLGAIVVE